MLKISKTKKKMNVFPSVLKDAPFQFIETYNSLRTNILFASVDKQCQKIVITSSIPHEGKTTVAINLAITFSNSGSHVLLIDCDLRKPSIEKFLNIDIAAPGLTNALAGFSKLDDCIIHLDELSLDVLPSGPVPPNPAYLLGCSKMTEIVETLSNRYDYILFDTPPVSLVTDAALLSKLSDGIIFVVRHNFTTIGEAQLAKTNLQNVGAPIVGTVLNAFNSEKGSKTSYGYHYKKYEYGYK